MKCVKRKSLCDKLVWFQFDKNNRRNTFYGHDKSEMKCKIADMYSSILAVDLETLAEKYPDYTFEEIDSVKTDAFVGLTTRLTENGEKVETSALGTGKGRRWSSGVVKMNISEQLVELKRLHETHGYC